MKAHYLASQLSLVEPAFCHLPSVREFLLSDCIVHSFNNFLRFNLQQFTASGGVPFGHGLLPVLRFLQATQRSIFMRRSTFSSPPDPRSAVVVVLAKCLDHSFCQLPCCSSFESSGKPHGSSSTDSHGFLQHSCFDLLFFLASPRRAMARLLVKYSYTCPLIRLASLFRRLPLLAAWCAKSASVFRNFGNQIFRAQDCSQALI